MIAISTRSNSPSFPLDSRFGRCSFFVFFNPRDGTFVTEKNPFFTEGSGAGVKAAQFLAKRKIEILLTGNVGPKALEVLQSAGIKVFSAAEGTAKEAIVSFQEGKLNPVKSPGVKANFGRGRMQRD